MNTRYLQFQEILELSKTMLECALNGAWDDLAKIEASRQQLITSFFEIPAALSEIEWLEPGILELLSIDKETVQKGKNELQSMSGNLQQLKVGRIGTDAYQKNM